MIKNVLCLVIGSFLMLFFICLIPDYFIERSEDAQALDNVIYLETPTVLPQNEGKPVVFSATPVLVKKAKEDDSVAEGTIWIKKDVEEYRCEKRLDFGKLKEKCFWQTVSDKDAATDVYSEEFFGEVNVGEFQLAPLSQLNPQELGNVQCYHHGFDKFVDCVSKSQHWFTENINVQKDKYVVKKRKTLIRTVILDESKPVTLFGKQVNNSLKCVESNCHSFNEGIIQGIDIVLVNKGNLSKTEMLSRVSVRSREYLKSQLWLRIVLLLFSLGLIGKGLYGLHKLNFFVRRRR